jgi:hypothetical protein
MDPKQGSSMWIKSDQDCLGGCQIDWLNSLEKVD